MENDFITARNIVLKKVSEDNPNYGLFICSLYGIIRSFSKYIDISIIEKIFLDSDINIYTGKLSDIINSSEIIGGINDEYVEGVSHPYYNYYFDLKNNTFAYDISNPFIYIKKSTPNETINTFIHEFLHLLKAYNVPFEIDQDIMVERHGITLHTMLYDGEGILDNISGVCLDECFNVMDTSKCLEEVKALRLFCSDKRVLDYISKLDINTLSDTKGFEFEVLLVNKLYDNDYFRNKFHNSVFSGDVDSFEDDFNDIFNDKNAYSDFNKLLDLILDGVEDGVSEDVLFEPCSSINDVINLYLDKVRAKLKVNY